jgi:hypothetical protein
MVMARLHVICGICGSLATNDNSEHLSYSIEKDWHDFGEHQKDGVIIKCANCSTIHDLSDTVPEKPEE